MGLARTGGGGHSRSVPHFSHGRWVSVQSAGLKQIKRSTYRGWDIEVVDRAVGMTLKRRQLSVLAQCDLPPFRFYRSSLHSEKMARLVAERFVDQWHEENGHLLSQDNVRDLRRKKMTRKLFKMRRTPPQPPQEK